MNPIHCSGYRVEVCCWQKTNLVRFSDQICKKTAVLVQFRY